MAASEYSSSVWDPVGNNQLTKRIESVQGINKSKQIELVHYGLQITGIVTSALDKSQKNCNYKTFRSDEN